MRFLPELEVGMHRTVTQSHKLAGHIPREVSPIPLTDVQPFSEVIPRLCQIFDGVSSLSQERHKQAHIFDSSGSSGSRLTKQHM